ncbi:MAG: glycoside hydrolase family 2 protein, partial [Haloarculaceae archaeon]
MHERSLGGEWQFRELADDEPGPGHTGGEWLAGTVPGGIYTDLFERGEIPDPLYGDNELDVQWVGESVNMHVGNEFDVGDALGPGDNEVRVRFRSPVEYGQERAAEYPYEVPCIRYPVDQPGRQFVRKAQRHYGWDWGPCLPTVGIYREISLVASSSPRVRYVKTEQDHAGEGIALTVRAGVDAPSAGEFDLTVDVAGVEATESRALDGGAQEVELTVRIGDDEDGVDLWWPNGYGDQPLYDLEVTAGDIGGHTVTERVGFRDLELVVEPDDAGTAFYFEVNGERVFAKGANTIPTAPLYGEVTEERYDHLLESAADANMNMLRVWGGGYYEEEYFYERCDELGLLVWQDFMFSCSLHPADEAFLETVEDEVRYQVRRLASHPSVAVWCGNNENEEAVQNWFVDHDHHEDHRDDYEKLYAGTVGPTCRAEDPSRTYWPGSPSSGPDEIEPYAFEKGDIHYWDVWHQGEPFEDYYTTEPRFVSEFGYQSFPSLDSLRTVMDGSDFNPTAPAMEHHQRNPGGNATILGRTASYFRFPFEFADFVYVSQLLQAEAMRTAVEHWRRHRPETMGALYWQLNDLWPVASWASVEYDGKWKAQQYAARRQFAPVLVSFHPTFEGADGAENAQAGADGEWPDVTAQTLWLTSDETDPVSGTVHLALYPLDGDHPATERAGDPLREWTVDVDLDAGESTDLLTVERADVPDGVHPGEVALRATYEAFLDSFPATAFFVDFKRLALPDTDLAVEIDG